MAGAIAEKVANDSWEHLMQKRMFQPLGMQSCGFGAMGTPAKTTLRQIDQPWQHKLILTLHRPIEPGPLADNPAVIGPAGTVHCSIVDWGKFITAHLRGEKGESGILKPETFKRLHTPPFGGDYAFGWLVLDRPWAGGPGAESRGQQHCKTSPSSGWPRPRLRGAHHDQSGRHIRCLRRTAAALILHFIRVRRTSAS